MLVRKDNYRHAMQSHQLVGASNKEKALVGAFSGHCSLIALLLDMTIITRWPEPAANNVPLETVQVHL